MKKNSGFTLIEILVVLGITIILATGGFLSLWNLKKHQSLRLSAESMVAFLRDVQQRSISQEGGLGWGARFYNPAVGRDSYWRFQGTDPLMIDEKIALPSGIEFADPDVGSTKDVNFAKISGLPDAMTVVKIKLSGDDSSIITININAQGTIESK